jgi:hypothetical protein
VNKGPIIDDQSEQLILTDRHGRLDVAVQDLEEDPAPQIVEIDDLNIPTSDTPRMWQYRTWKKILHHKLLRLMISTFSQAIHHPWRWRQWNKRRPQLRQ